MLTHLPDGTPYDLEDLVSALGFRIETVSDLAEFAFMREEASCSEQALARAISCIRDDYDVFRKAVDEWYESKRRSCLE